MLLIVVIITAFASCRKYQSPPGHDHGNHGISHQRKVRYELYTDRSQAGDKKNIHFSIFMRDGRNTIFDSALAVMTVENIPDFDHRIIIEKLVPDNDPATLAVGFNYEIDNIGISWYLDAFPSGDTLKVLNTPFR